MNTKNIQSRIDLDDYKTLEKIRKEVSKSFDISLSGIIRQAVKAYIIEAKKRKLIK